MSDLEQQFREDRILRDAARENFFADVEHVKTSFSGKGLAERTVDRVGAGAKDAFEHASIAADNSRGVLAALIGAIILWFARNPIIEALGPEIERLLGEQSDDDAVERQPPTAPEHGNDTVPPDESAVEEEIPGENDD